MAWLRIDWFLALMVGALLNASINYVFIDNPTLMEPSKFIEQQVSSLLPSKQKPNDDKSDNQTVDVEEESVEVKENQKILKRTTCSMRGFEESTIRRLNNHQLPNVQLSFDNNSGVCAEANADKCLPAFTAMNLSPLYFSAKPIKTSVCMVHKSMSTVMRALQCLLNNPLKFLYAEKDLLDPGRAGCDSDSALAYHDFRQAANERNITTENGWKYVLVVRDPIDRFISGYTHLCIYGMIADCVHRCNGCGANLTCFLERQYEKFKKMATDGQNIDRTTSHMAPQSWHCNLKELHSNYTFLRYNSNSERFFRDDLRPFLTSRNVSASAIDYIHRRLTSTRTGHSTTGFALRPWLEKRIRGSRYLLRLFMQIYFYDYEVFDWPRPQIPE
ncbi:WAPL domain-containing protein [Aphelenchoides besseyi]|nr:WAPL domain-containing protein [Aphelenchoides besseyi]KAI6222815.1 WAPL domain-containing protein [Aphelenchoides besseyi]